MLWCKRHKLFNVRCICGDFYSQEITVLTLPRGSSAEDDLLKQLCCSYPWCTRRMHKYKIVSLREVSWLFCPEILLEIIQKTDQDISRKPYSHLPFYPLLPLCQCRVSLNFHGSPSGLSYQSTWPDYPPSSSQSKTGSNGTSALFHFFLLINPEMMFFLLPFFFWLSPCCSLFTEPHHKLMQSNCI